MPVVFDAEVECLEGSPRIGGGSDARGGAPSWTWQWHVIGTNERLDWAIDAISQFRRDVVLVPQAGVEPATFRV